MGDGWKAEWDPVVAAIGTKFGLLEAPEGVAADPVELGAIRRYLEPLEFDCALHYDPGIARANGYAGVIAPYTSLSSFALLPMWRPGLTLFTSDDRNAQPEVTAVKPKVPSYFPPFSGYFATDLEIDYMRPATVGDVVSLGPSTLLSCEPKETSIGRGAFVKIRTRIMDQHGEVLAEMVSGAFFYNPQKETTQ